MKRFFAVRKSDSLQSPAIFTCWDDCSLHVDMKSKDRTVEFRFFTSIAEAVNYIDIEEDHDEDQSSEVTSSIDQNDNDEDYDDNDDNDDDDNKITQPAQPQRRGRKLKSAVKRTTVAHGIGVPTASSRKRPPSTSSPPLAPTNKRSRTKESTTDVPLCDTSITTTDDRQSTEAVVKQRQNSPGTALSDNQQQSQQLTGTQPDGPSDETAATAKRNTNTSGTNKSNWRAMAAKNVKNWECNFELLQAYKAKYGHTKLYKKGSRKIKDIDEKFHGLCDWLRNQRKKERLLSIDSNDTVRLMQLQRLEECLGCSLQRLEESLESEHVRENNADGGVLQELDVTNKQHHADEAREEQQKQISITTYPDATTNTATTERTKARAIANAIEVSNIAENEENTRITCKRCLEWEKNFALLQDFKRKYSHCNIREEAEEMDKKFLGLPKWLVEQRRRKKLMLSINSNVQQQQQAKEKMKNDDYDSVKQTQLHLQRLDELLGSEPVDKWELKFELLEEYKAQHGHCRVVANQKHVDVKFKGLYTWLLQQRKRKKELLSKGSFQQHQKPVDDGSNIDDEEDDNDGSGGNDNATKLDAEQLQRLDDLMGSDRHDPEDEEAYFAKNFARLKAFKEENGHVNVTRPVLGSRELYNFVVRMQNHIGKYKAGRERYMRWKAGFVLDDSKFQMLTEELGLVERKETELSALAGKEAPTWDDFFEGLKEFKQKNNGSVEVPYNPVTPLRNWIVKQRSLFKELKEASKPNKKKDISFAASRLTPERIAKLTSIGFSFNTKERSSFEERAVEWLQYRQNNGREPPHDLPNLGPWARKMRTYHKLHMKGEKTPLTQEQFDKLDSWGFIWDRGFKQPEVVTPPKSWDERFEELLQFRKQNGNVNVPQQYPVLGNWVHRQRKAYTNLKNGKKSSLTQYRLQKLQEIDFVFLSRVRTCQKRPPPPEQLP